MLDIKFIRENQDLVKEAARKKHIEIDLERLLALDEKRRALIGEVYGMRKQHKDESESVKGLSPEARSAIVATLRIAKDKISHKEFELRAVEEEFNELMLTIPNVADPSVPEGDSDADNQEIRKWSPNGEASILPTGGRDYLSLMQAHDMLDIDRGTKVSGFRGYFLKNDGVFLELAIMRFALDWVAQKGFVPIVAPSLVKRENLIGTGWVAGGAKDEDVYKVQDELYLAGTAEVAMMGYHAGEVLSEAELPKKYVAFSPCFRREIGSHGKDTKGIIRVHEFYKVEQVILCRADHQESVKWHEELTKNSEALMHALEIPYHVVLNCGGDIGLGQVKKYDIED